MKKQATKTSNEGYAEMQAQQAIKLITQWIEERYPKISSRTKARVIAQCLIEVRDEKRYGISLN
jgi:N-acetyl-anhydromuramyl-L-alanine amidase AmpD